MKSSCLGVLGCLGGMFRATDSWIKTHDIRWAIPSNSNTLMDWHHHMPHMLGLETSLHGQVAQDPVLLDASIWEYLDFFSGCNGKQHDLGSKTVIDHATLVKRTNSTTWFCSQRHMCFKQDHFAVDDFCSILFIRLLLQGISLTERLTTVICPSWRECSRCWIWRTSCTTCSGLSAMRRFCLNLNLN